VLAVNVTCIYKGWT